MIKEPVVAFYCATFLKPEMFHIYRQITGLRQVRPFVITQKRENQQKFPFDNVEVMKKPASHFLRRFWFRQLRNKPWHISNGELDGLTWRLDRADARLLHIFFGHIAVHLLPLIQSWGKPTVVSFHGADVQVDMEKPSYRASTRTMLDSVTRVLVRSDSLRRAVVELGCDENKIDVVRTGIPRQEFPFRQRNFPENGEWRLIQACRLIEKKGLATTLHAFTRFLAEYPKSHLIIAGEGPMLPELRELIRKLKIDQRVELPGFLSQDRLREVFYASHVFLHPSETGSDGNQEGIPNAMLEAMATGLPVFATNHGGIPEAVESGVSGMLVPEGDYEALAASLLAAARDKSLLARMAKNGADVVAQKFDQLGQIKRLEGIYLKLIGRSGLPALPSNHLENRQAIRS